MNDIFDVAAHSEHAEAPGEPVVHEEPQEVAIEEFLLAQQKQPAMPFREVLNRTDVESLLEEFALRLEDDMKKSRLAMQEAALVLTDGVQAQLDAAVGLAKAEVRGAALEAAEDVAEEAGKIVVSVLCEEVGLVSASLNKHAETMLAAAHKMHQASSELPSAPSRFVWLVTGAVGFWFITKYIDLARWTAIAETVIKTIKGVAA